MAHLQRLELRDLRHPPMQLGFLAKALVHRGRLVFQVGGQGPTLLQPCASAQGAPQVAGTHASCQVQSPRTGGINNVGYLLALPRQLQKPCHLERKVPTCWRTRSFHSASTLSRSSLKSLQVFNDAQQQWCKPSTCCGLSLTQTLVRTQLVLRDSLAVSLSAQISSPTKGPCPHGRL